ncbi:hypothetical protein [Roseibium sp. RKSG952]|uniref:hypothetical protein n=1 Tax=Roseibium sp. RKSG952 TaxID=2529384 RepID=UPI0012BC4825|nr:hypothetical protein [Roseibium sp. RKSG952]MTH97454.1 hypothetical protein [Roseibium sp. RKSG952]
MDQHETDTADTADTVQVEETAVSPEQAAHIEKARHALALTGELIALADDENRRLASMRPTGLMDIVARKGQMVKELEAWLTQTRVSPQILASLDDDLRAQLTDQTAVLKEKLAENTELLSRSLTVTRRRSQTIVQAVRDTRKMTAGYSGDGQENTVLKHSVSITGGFQA